MSYKMLQRLLNLGRGNKPGSSATSSSAISVSPPSVSPPIEQKKLVSYERIPTIPESEITGLETLIKEVNNYNHVFRGTFDGKVVVVKRAFSTSRAEAYTLNRLQGVTAVPKLYGVTDRNALVVEFCPGPDFNDILLPEHNPHAEGYASKHHGSYSTLAYSEAGLPFLTMVCEQFADNIAQSAERGIFVRDLKPSEIKFQTLEPDFTFRRVDYGMASELPVFEGDFKRETRGILAVCLTGYLREDFLKDWDLIKKCDELESKVPKKLDALRDLIAIYSKNDMNVTLQGITDFTAALKEAGKELDAYYLSRSLNNAK